MYATYPFYILQFLGQYPIHKKSSKFQSSLLHLAWSLVIFLTIFLISIKVIFMHEIRKANFVLQIANHLDASNYILLVIFSIVIPVIKRKDVCSLFQTVTEVDESLKKFGVSINSKFPTIGVVILLMVFVIQNGATLICEIYYPVWSQGIGSISFAYYQVIGWFVYLSLINFAYIAFHLSMRFRLLNKQLEEILLIYEVDGNKKVSPIIKAVCLDHSSKLGYDRKIFFCEMSLFAVTSPFATSYCHNLVYMLNLVLSISNTIPFEAK